jgi:choline dehydrogenase
MTCDVAVVGGGTAGCVVAGRLAAESEAAVVLVEAGPDYGARDSGGWPADLLDGGALVASHDWGYASGDIPGREPIAFPRARVIGGCSSHNGSIAAVGCPEDYDAWAATVGDDGWSAEALRPFLARALARLRVRHYRDEEVGPFHHACLDAASALGLPRADDLDDLDGGVGFGLEPVNVDSGVRINTAFAYLDPVRGRPNHEIVANALCDRFVLRPDGVEIVAWRGGAEVRVHAATAVLCAGTYGSPAILLRSGIGDPEQLAALEIPVVHALSGVGRNLHDHPLLEIDFTGTERLRELLAEASARMFVPEEQTIGKARSTRASGPYDLHAIPVAASPHGLLAGRVFLAVAALEPLSRGRLTLRSTDPEAPPVLHHGYLSDPDGHDLAVLAEGLERLREMAAAPSLRDLIGTEITPIGADLPTAIRRLHGHYFHPVGTCAMGAADDPLAVCDGRGRLHGLEQVVVADCALMPTIPRANTNVPAVTVAERITDLLLER